jgi:glycosyltransferase involved in cell wall biosynthesis
MKILFPYMARWKSVNWTRYHSLLTYVAEKGHQVYVLQPPAMESEETNFQEIEAKVPSNLQLIDVGIPASIWKRHFPLDKLVKKGLYSVYSLATARNVVAQNGVDVVLLYNIPQYPYLSLPVAKVFDYADDYIDMLARELGPLNCSALTGFGRKVLDRMVERSDLVFAVSNVLAKTYGRKAQVLPNGVDPEEIERAGTAPLDLKLRRPVIGFIGSFEYFIDFDLMLDLMQALPEMTFLLVGRGRLWEYVRAQTSERGLKNVVLTGGVPHSDIFRYIDQMDICLNIFKKIPVSHGACPIKLFEYLAMKKPVITTRLEELSYIDKGFLVYGDDVGEIIHRIRDLLSEGGLKDRVVEQGYRETMERYRWDAIADEFVGQIEGLRAH